MLLQNSSYFVFSLHKTLAILNKTCLRYSKLPLFCFVFSQNMKTKGWEGANKWALFTASGWIMKDADQRGQVEGILKAPEAHETYYRGEKEPVLRGILSDFSYYCLHNYRSLIFWVLPTSVTSHCDYWQFRCNNGQCISKYELCNGRRECDDGSNHDW